MDFTKDLNERQAEACVSQALHLRIIAGAGTGKTRVLTYRIAHMICNMGIAPGRLVAITFTKKAARELGDRAANLLNRAGVNLTRTPIISTIHAFCNRFLRFEASHIRGYNNKFTIVDEDDQGRIIKDVAARLGWENDKVKKRELLAQIGNLKGKGLLPEDVDEGSIIGFQGGLTGREIKEGYSLYQENLRRIGAMDFDDLLLYTYKILENFPDVREHWAHRFQAFLIDEFQDTDPLQYEIVKLLLTSRTFLSVVGDPDQTIYTWRGAENRLITTQLSEDFPDLVTVTLDVNYRSTQNILDRANTLIKHNSDRLEKSLRSFDGQVGEPVSYANYYSPENEAQMVVNQILNLKRKGYKYSDIVVLYRAKHQSSQIEKWLTYNRIPYVVVAGQPFFGRQEVKDAMAYLRLLVNEDDDISFRRAITAPSFGLGEKSLDLLAGTATSKGKSILKYLTDSEDISFLSAKVRNHLAKLIGLITQTRVDLEGRTIGFDVQNILENYLDKVGLLNYVSSLDTKDAEKKLDINDSHSRLDNVKELLSQVRDFIDTDHFDIDGNKIDSTLAEFLIDVVLLTTQDAIVESDNVSLMTVHVAKGLEFPVVFVIGMNEDVFPTRHAVERGDQGIEEDRRLFYVAITRAEKLLYISSRNGGGFGGNYDQSPSRFLKEIGFGPKKGDSAQPSSGGDLLFKTHGGAVKPYTRPKIFDDMQASDKLLNSRPRRPVGQVNASVFQPGDRIAHVSFGVGKVIDVGATSIKVDFGGEVGVKNLAKSFTKAFRKLGPDE